MNSLQELFNEIISVGAKLVIESDGDKKHIQMSLRGESGNKLIADNILITHDMIKYQDYSIVRKMFDRFKKIKAEARL